jgi:hypothetical protein
MTEVEGTIKQVGQGLTQKTYKYDALGSLVDIITNAAGMLTIFTSFRSITNIRYRPSCASRCAEAQGRKRRWWRWQWRRRIQLSSPIRICDTNACYAAQQVARDFGPVDVPATLALV